MKNLIFTLFAALLIPDFISAQASSFTIVPIPSYVTAPPETFDTAAIATIKNVSNVRDSFHWERIVIELPGGFRTAVCDPVQCYFENVNSQSFVLEPGEEGALDLHFYNYGQESGSGLVRVKVNNVKNPSDSLSGVYYYNTTSGTDDPLPAANVRLFPNPFTEGFTLDHADDVAAVRVFSLLGREVAYFTPSANQRYSLVEQPAGTYIIALIAQNGQVFQALEVRKQ